MGKFKGVQSGDSWTPAHSKSVKRRAEAKVSRTETNRKIPCVTRTELPLALGHHSSLAAPKRFASARSRAASVLRPKLT
jgi:hypothetical protein